MTPVKPGSKYHPLYQALRTRGDAALRLTFAQIERLIGEALPASARRGTVFWSNRRQGGLQAAAWLDAGYRVAAVDPAARWVRFERPAEGGRRADPPARWDGALIRSLRQHLGVDQTGLAEVLGVRQQTVSEWETGTYLPSRSRSKHLNLVAEQAGFFDAGSAAGRRASRRQPRD